MNIQVTIIIPTYNRAALLPKTINSVLNQTYNDFELLILDDASTDDTKEIIAPFLKDKRIRFITHHQNIGIAANRNYGITHARGAYIAMLDSDDVWLDQNKLAEQVKFLDKNPACAIIGTWMIQINEQDQILRKIKFVEEDNGIRRSLLYRNHIAQSSVLFRKDAALEAGGYDETLVTMEDHDLWLKIGAKHKLAVLPIYALGYRVHQNKITKSRRQRVALDELAVIWRHGNKYPGLFIGIVKGIARLIRAIIYL